MNFPTGQYSIIYCDPPWRFRCYSDWTQAGRLKASSASRRVENHYPTMTLADIRALPVSSIAAPDCALFLWATMPMLPEALATIESWGFTYKTTAFTWAKLTKSGASRKGGALYHVGLGYWTRANAELCLLATRGAPKRIDKSIRSLIVSPVGRHSAKPPEARDRIVQLMGDLPRIELFARETAPGWHAWGLEAASHSPNMSHPSHPSHPPHSPAGAAP